MKHLHLNFISASLAAGLGFFFLIIVGWQARMVATPGIHAMPFFWIQAGAFLVGGSTLVYYGWHEVRHEIVSLKR